MANNNEPRYYKARESAAGERFTIIPPYFYMRRKPHPTVENFCKAGVLELLPGHPGIGFDVEELTDAQLNYVPPPDPEIERPLETEALLERLPGWTAESLTFARARYGFPDPTHFIGGPSAERPDDARRPAWKWSVVERWLDEAPVLSLLQQSK
jgi:hypothetical protein